MSTIPRRFAIATLGAVVFATIAVVARFAAADNPPAVAPLTASAGGSALRGSWEFSPYRVLIYVKSTASPRAAPLRLAEFAAALDSEREKQLGGVWKLTVSAAPAKLPWDQPGEPQRVTADQIAASPTAQDKVFLLGIDARAAETVLTVRELDVRTGLWGATTTTRVPSAARLPAAAICALRDAFSPLVRIDDIADTGVTCRIRGGGLLQSGRGPELLKPGDVLRPIVRHFDAEGETVKGGVFPAAWTWLSVESADAGVARCSLSTGMQEPLALVYDGRTEYLGLMVKTRAADATELVIHARGPGDKPLEDLEILARIGKDKPPQPIGRTDARGAVKIESQKIELLTLYVRSGSDLLARVPLVPGVEPTLTLAVDDNGQCQCGFDAGNRRHAGQRIAPRTNVQRKQCDLARLNFHCTGVRCVPIGCDSVKLSRAKIALFTLYVRSGAICWPACRLVPGVRPDDIGRYRPRPMSMWVRRRDQRHAGQRIAPERTYSVNSAILRDSIFTAPRASVRPIGCGAVKIESQDRIDTLYVRSGSDLLARDAVGSRRQAVFYWPWTITVAMSGFRVDSSHRCTAHCSISSRRSRCWFRRINHRFAGT